MHDIINYLKALFETHGFKVAVIVLLTILLVNILKKPIIKKAENYAKKYDCDKSVITKYLTILPYIVSFIISFIWELIIVNFVFNQIDYEMLLTNVFMYGSLSIASFETLKLQFEAYAAKKQQKKRQESKIVSTQDSQNEKEFVSTNSDIL